MRNRSDLYNLMAKKEEAKKAAALQQMRQIHDAQSHAEAMHSKIREILDERQVTGQVLAADLRSASAMNNRLAAEAAVQSERAEQLQQALAASRSEVAKQSHKARFLDEAATTARRTEAEEREKRAEAARPTLRR